MKEQNGSIQELIDLVKTFCEERDWDQFHNAKDLSIGISTEASELLDIFRFKTEKDVLEIFKQDKSRSRINDEVADILFFLLRFAQMNDIDLKEVLQNKISKNAAKYPVEKYKGSNASYKEED